MISTETLFNFDLNSANVIPFTGPTLFMHSTLIGTHGFETPRPVADSLTGSLSSSLHRLNDDNDRDGAFFIFGDLSIKVEGIFKLRFSLFDIHEGQVIYITSVESIPFRAATNYAGASESTPLTRKFCNQGMRLRLRNPARILPKKRGPQSEDYTPRQYKAIRVSRSQEKSPDPSTPCQKSKGAAPISAQYEPKEFSPALSSTPTKSRTPLGNVPLPRRGTVSDHHPQSMFNQHGLSPEQHFPNSFAESQLGSIGSDNFSAQRLSYQDGFYNLPSNTPSTRDQMLWQGFGQRAEVIQSQVASRLSSQQTNYRQNRQYLAQHGVGDITPSSQQKDTSGVSAIDDVQDIHGFGEILPSNQEKDTSGFSAIDDVQDIHGFGDIPPSWIYDQR